MRSLNETVRGWLQRKSRAETQPSPEKIEPCPTELESATLIERWARDSRTVPDAVRHALHDEVCKPLLLHSLIGNKPQCSTDVVQVVSLGTHCFTSAFAKRWQLKKWSGPFDWAFSSWPMIRHCFEDDFITFLDRRQYEPIPLADRRDGADVNRVDHRFYRDKFHVRFVFNHHDVHLDEDYAYIVRCVDRLRDCLDSPTKKYFLIFSWFNSHAVQELVALAAVLAKRTTSFRLMCVLVKSGPGNSPQLEVLHEDAQSKIYAYRPFATWHPLAFENQSDELLIATAVHADIAEFARSKAALSCGEGAGATP
jgi:Putative papain-like cysteine peptidase (DUF1796)